MLCILLRGDFYQQNTTNCTEMRTRGKKQSGRESDPNNADPEQVGKVNPNPECKHQITLQHTVYGIRIHSFIGLSLHWNSTNQSRDHLLISMDWEQTPDLLLYVYVFFNIK